MVSPMMRRGWMLAVVAGLISLMPGCRLLPRSADTSLQSGPSAQAEKGSESPTIPGPPVPVVTPAGTAQDASGPKAGVPAVVAIPGTKVPDPRPAQTALVVPVRKSDIDLEQHAGHVTPAIPITPIRVGPLACAGTEESSEKMVEPPLLAALRCYLEKRPREALDHLQKFDALNQELLICLLPLAVQLAEKEKPSDRQSAMAVEQLESVMYGLRTRAPLIVEKMCLCKSIGAFGVYEAMAGDHVFQPGEQLRVYAELRNFSSERRDADGGPSLFVTRLASIAEIRDASGKTVWKQPLQRGEPDRSQTPRHDYFDHYRFYLPELRAGQYILEVTVEDLATHRKARRAVDLKVGLLQQQGS